MFFVAEKRRPQLSLRPGSSANGKPCGRGKLIRPVSIRSRFLFLVVYDHHDQCKIEYDRNDAENDPDLFEHTFVLLESVI